MSEERTFCPRSPRSPRSPRLGWLLFVRFALAALAGLAALSSGCTRAKSDAAASADSGSALAKAQEPATSSAASSTAASPRPLPPSSLHLLEGKLAVEAQGRPTITPKAEDVLTAIVASGVPLTDEAQHIASTIGAHFCIGAKSPEGLAMSACEYNDEAGAVAGRAMSAKAFATIEHRDIVVNKKTTLTILQNPFTPKSQAAHDKAVAVFTKL